MRGAVISKVVLGAALAVGLGVSEEMEAVHAPAVKLDVPKARPMSAEMTKALNAQLKAELESAYIYLGMAKWFDEQNLSGFAHWFRIQSEEEMTHFKKVYDFMQDRGVQVVLPSLEAPNSDFDSIVDVFLDGLKREQELTVQIHEIYSLAQDLREYDAGSFVLWFLQEQVEEENLFLSYIDHLIRIGGHDADPAAILWMDRELGNRAPEQG
ncbi:MAG: ferritin [Waddliaceae bacterium]|nr:ferritin [Waddliaceae bacterium]